MRHRVRHAVRGLYLTTLLTLVTTARAQGTFVRIHEANHVEAWNADPVRYAATLNDWCTAHGIGTAPR